MGCLSSVSDRQTGQAVKPDPPNPHPEWEQHETNEWLVNEPRKSLEQREPLAGRNQFFGVGQR